MSEPAPDYVSAISAHLSQGTEDSLSRAYELGRQALARGLGILDVLSLYESALRQLVLSATPEEQARAASGVEAFFREMLCPYEMSFRGYREANDELKRLNLRLEGAYSELQHRQTQLVQSAKLASIGELVAGVAHEINNPLTFVISHLATVRRKLGKFRSHLTEQVAEPAHQAWEHSQKRLAEMETGLERMRVLVLKLRTFARLDEGERKVVSIRESIDSVLTILHHRIEGQVSLETHFGELDRIDCFAGLLNQAVMNLVVNALDAIEATGKAGSIVISTGADGDRFVITVSDDGAGIPAHVRERVFEPFFTTKAVGKGTGLGLSITYSIVERHKGTLTLQDRPGGGTIARIEFPILEP